MTAVKKLLILGATLCLVVQGGIRGPWKYNGVVIFDRWGACHLYSGIYLMEVSEKVKDLLRPFAGMAMLIDAKEVHQPMNPGDGLITKLEVLGPAGEPETVKTNRPPDVEGLVLRASPNLPETGVLELIIELRNEGAQTRNVEPMELAPTVFAKSEASDCMNFLTPADGPSFALVTRTTLGNLRLGKSCGGDGNRRRYGLALVDGASVPVKSTLAPGEAVAVHLSFSASPGEYAFLAGYGGGVHAARPLASNFIDFDVDAAGRAHLVPR